MTEDFVSFELAKKLKEKGYPQEPDIYGRTAYYEYCGLRKVVSRCNDAVWYLSEVSRDNIFASPTISQVLNWLRKEKKILVVAAPAFLYKEARYFWQCGIYEISLLPNVMPFHKFINNKESYESAILSGIEYAIDNFLI